MGRPRRSHNRNWKTLPYPDRCVDIDQAKILGARLYLDIELFFAEIDFAAGNEQRVGRVDQQPGDVRDAIVHRHIQARAAYRDAHVVGEYQAECLDHIEPGSLHEQPAEAALVHSDRRVAVQARLDSGERMPDAEHVTPSKKPSARLLDDFGVLEKRLQIIFESQTGICGRYRLACVQRHLAADLAARDRKAERVGFGATIMDAHAKR